MHSVNIALGILPLGLLAEEHSAFQMPVQAGNNGIVPDIQHAENAGGPALLGEQGKAVLDGLSGVPVQAGLAVQGNGPFLPGADAENAFQGLSPAAAVQSGQAQNLAPVGLKAHVPQLIVHTRQMLHFQ